MTRKTQRYSKEFRTEAVKNVLDQGLSINLGASHLPVPEGTLGQWITAVRKGLNPLNGAIVRPGTKKKKVLTKVQLDTFFRLLEQYNDVDAGKGSCIMYNSCKNALRPAWFWQTILKVLRYTAIRQNQLLYYPGRGY